MTRLHRRPPRLPTTQAAGLWFSRHQAAAHPAVGLLRCSHRQAVEAHLLHLPLAAGCLLQAAILTGPLAVPAGLLRDMRLAVLLRVSAEFLGRRLQALVLPVQVFPALALRARAMPRNS
jgi:hypothetical protein